MSEISRVSLVRITATCDHCNKREQEVVAGYFAMLDGWIEAEIKREDYERGGASVSVLACSIECLSAYTLAWGRSGTLDRQPPGSV